QQIKTRDELKKRKFDLASMKEKFEQKEKDISLAQKAAVLAQQEELCHLLKRDLDSSNHELEKVRYNLSNLLNLLRIMRNCGKQKKIGEKNELRLRKK